MTRTFEESPIRIRINETVLYGHLVVPARAKSIVFFVHGAGGTRFSPRNRFAAKLFNQRGIATVLPDLLTQEEAILDNETCCYRFDMPFLTTRVLAVTDWLSTSPQTSHMKIGYYGTSTGSAAALLAATLRFPGAGAVVSRGGRPDLAGEALRNVKIPTLLIVGENDPAVLQWNEKAFEKLGAIDKKLTIVPDAGHLFEEPGAMDMVALLAAGWFIKYLSDECLIDSSYEAGRDLTCGGKPQAPAA